MKINIWVGLMALCCGATSYADLSDAITQGNSNADRIAAQAQNNITQQQQILAQRLQILSTAMQAQNPRAPIVVPAMPSTSGQTQGSTPTSTPATPPVSGQTQGSAPTSTPATPPVSGQTQGSAPTPTLENTATGLKQNNTSRNQWDYGF